KEFLLDPGVDRQHHADLLREYLPLIGVVGLQLAVLLEAGVDLLVICHQELDGVAATGVSSSWHGEFLSVSALSRSRLQGTFPLCVGTPLAAPNTALRQSHSFRGKA